MLWHYYNDYTCSVWPWKHQQQKRMNTRCAQQRKSNSSAPQVSQASPNKRNQDTAVMDGGRRTPGRSWTHLTVPCSLSPSCSCIQTPRPDLNPARNSSLVCWASKKPGCSVSSYSSKRKRSTSCTHVEKAQSVSAIRPAECFLLSLCAPEGSRWSTRSEELVCVRERERWRGGGACMHLCVNDLLHCVSALGCWRNCVSQHPGRVPLGMSDALIQRPVSCSAVHMITEPLELHASFSPRYFTPKLFLDLLCIMTFKHIFHPSSHSCVPLMRVIEMLL